MSLPTNAELAGLYVAELERQHTQGVADGRALVDSIAVVRDAVLDGLPERRVSEVAISPDMASMAAAMINTQKNTIAELTARCDRLGWHVKGLEEKLAEVVDRLNDNIDDDTMIVPGDIEVQILRFWSRIQDGDIPDKWPGDAPEGGKE